MAATAELDRLASDLEARPAIAIVLALLACATACGSPQGTRATSHVSPLAALQRAPAAHDALDGDFADPFVLRGADGYYAFATGAERLHLQVAHSRDLTTWTHLGEALPELPAWALK